jgi:GR25 family glycosyltransferase involved in LPS biosynthesis
MRLEDVQMVCISLDRRPDRWTAFKATADAAGLPVQRVSAVDARSFGDQIYEMPGLSLLTAHNIRERTRRSHYEIDAPGAIGCSLSHFKVWKQLLSSSAPAIIVFEDDAELPLNLKPQLQQVIAELPFAANGSSGWDLVQFQLTTYGKGVTGCSPREGLAAPWQHCTGLMGTYGYMVSRRGAERLLSRAYPIEMHVDAYMAYMSSMGHLDMIWHPLIDIPGPDKDSDIEHGNPGILGVPTNMDKHGIVALELTSVLGLVAMAAVAGGLIALAYGKRK